MIAHLLSLALLASAPESAPAQDIPRSEEPLSDESPLEQPDEQASEPPSEFGELEAARPISEPQAGQGALAPLSNYGDQAGPEFGHLEAAPPPPPEGPKHDPDKFQEPDDFGPFFEPEPVSEVKFPGDAHRPDRDKPFASVAGGTFCFVEDSVCGASLIADADVGVGMNIITTDRGFDVPYTQFRVRGGVTVRPLQLANKRWHRWAVGAVASWSMGSGSITATSRDRTETLADVTENDPIRAWRVALLNQLWLSQKRNALHLDVTIGGVRSSVLDAPGRYWGTHAEIALGLGGWGGLYFAGDFLDSDTRIFLGMRGHGIATGPLIALIVLGLVAGGVAL